MTIFAAAQLSYIMKHTRICVQYHAIHINYMGMKKYCVYGY